MKTQINPYLISAVGLPVSFYLQWRILIFFGYKSTFLTNTRPCGNQSYKERGIMKATGIVRRIDSPVILGAKFDCV